MSRYVVGVPPTVDGSTLSTTLGRYSLKTATSGNLVVVHTTAAAAHVVASAIDGACVDGVLGTIAGDDTVLVVADEETGAPELAARLDRIAHRT
jgi:transcriptional regulator of arginine metabolism